MYNRQNAVLYTKLVFIKLLYWCGSDFGLSRGEGMGCYAALSAQWADICSISTVRQTEI